MEEVGLPRGEGFRELPLGQRRMLMWGGESRGESWGGEEEED